MKGKRRFPFTRAWALGILVLLGVFLAAPIVSAADRSAVKKVPPTYPALARKMRIAGTVKLEVKVDPSGKPQDIKVVSGHPLLGPAAKECVSQWRFSPADAETTEVIEVAFTM
jgi:TonB family protein